MKKFIMSLTNLLGNIVSNAVVGPSMKLSGWLRDYGYPRCEDTGTVIHRCLCKKHFHCDQSDRLPA